MRAEEARFATPEQVVQQAWALRTVDRFALFFGLMERTPGPESASEPWRRDETDRVRKTPLFDRAVQWRAG